MFNFIRLNLIIFLFILSCNEGGSPNAQITEDKFIFNPIFRGGSKPSTPIGIPVPAQNFKVKAEPGKVTLTWNIPKSYLSDEIKIGYRIFEKRIIGNDFKVEWNFAEATSEDWSLQLIRIKAGDCKNTGECSHTVEIGGPIFVSYAIIAYWDIDNLSSAKSTYVYDSVTTMPFEYDFDFSPGFMDTTPAIVGAIVNELNRTPEMGIFNFRSEVTPWFLLDGSLNQDTQRLKYAAPIHVGLAPDGLTMILPDYTFNRGIYLSKGTLDSCDIFPEGTRSLCYQIIVSKPFAPYFALGQETFTRALSFEDNPQPASRKFKSNTTTILESESGNRYFFVVDEQRILVRKDEIFICDNDPGEDGDAVYGPEGYCGFKWSIGTYSPRQRCAFSSVDGSPITGEDSCEESDFDYSLADSTPPTNYSLRKPGNPIIVGKHLYIPDSGNARILRIANFEEAFKTCGRLLKPGSTEENDFCKFDMVLGQVPSTPGNMDRFEKRNCIRGGERGGFDGLVALSDNAAFIDPLGSGGSGGVGCRLDSIIDGGKYRKSRSAGDFMDSTLSDISPDTALLAETTKRTFRSPTHIEMDKNGFFYVMDHGITRVESKVGDNASTLPPRIMIWRKDPFSFQACVPDDPGAEVPSCNVDTDGICHGSGCVERECSGAECNATWFIGQPAELFGFTHLKGQTLGVDFTPEGYYPITSFSLGSNAGLTGVWAVTGVDARVFHFKEISQISKPAIHNQLIEGDEFTSFKRGIFSGITVDNIAGAITAWDAKSNVGFIWIGVPQ